MKRDEEGMILINVLMFVAIAAGLVLLMITREELALDHGLRDREVARAIAAVRGGELSAVVALRRDAETAGDQDYPGEAWGAVAEKGAPIEGGTFDLAVSDAEGRFNINSVRSGEAASLILFTRIARQLGMNDQQIDAAVAYVRVYGPVTDLRPMATLGLKPEVLEQMRHLVTALPGTTTINLNAADEEMMAFLFQDASVAQRLVALRDRQGFLTAKDLTEAKATLPWGTSFHSTTFWVRTRATIGGSSQQQAALIRRRTVKGKIEAVAVARWRNAAIPAEAPGFYLHTTN